MPHDDDMTDPIVHAPWPGWTQLDGRPHHRTWHFDMSQPLPAGELRLPTQIGIDVVVSRGPTASSLIVTTFTARNPMTDEMFFDSAIRMFTDIEAQFGRIRTIEDMERDVWRPFRSEPRFADVSGLEADWLACDADDRVALFSTAGSGYAPEEYLKDIEAHGEAIEAIENLPATTHATLFPDLKPDLKNTWRLVAERGLFAFDNCPSGGPYKLDASPAKPMSRAQLPEKIAALIGRIRFRTLRFADHETLTNAQIALDLR